jgi:hypothetical protein
LADAPYCVIRLYAFGQYAWTELDYYLPPSLKC